MFNTLFGKVYDILMQYMDNKITSGKFFQVLIK